jgi:hypothetical protein
MAMGGLFPHCIGGHGVSVGSPVAARYYQWDIQTEVDALFFLMPMVYFFVSIPLCMAAAAAGIRRRLFAEKLYLKLLYICLCTILIPTFFYGIAAPLYYA